MVSIGNTGICYMLGRISDHNATDKAPMDEMPLISVFGFGVGVWGIVEGIFCIRVLGVGLLSRDRSADNFTPITLWSNLFTLKVSVCQYHWSVSLKN